jgi:hypothetical protein
VSRRTKVVVIAAGLLLLVLGLRRARDPAQPAPAVARRSAWVLPRPQPPRLLPAAVPPPASPASEPPLRVQAVDVTGGPIPGARVTADGQPERLLGLTGELGIVEIPLAQAHLPPVGWLIIGADGYGHRRSPYVAGSAVLVKLVPESRVAGVVTEAGTGAPMPGLTVLCGRRERTLSDPQGRFSCGDLGPGDLTLEAYGRGYHGALARPVMVSLATVITDLRLEVTRSAFTARGRVTAEGAPVAGAEVEAGEREALTDEAGHYLLADLPAGSYEISVRTGVVSAAQPGPLVVSDRDVERDLEIGARTALLVEVVDTSGKPVEKQEVSLEQALDEDAAIGASEPTDAAGRVRFAGLLATRARLSGPRLPTETVDLRRPRVRPVRLVARESGRLQGRVHAPPGTSGAERRVCATKDGDSSRCEDTDADGSFSFALSPGHYRVEVRSGRVWSSAQPAEAAAEADVRQDATSEVVLEVPADDAELAGRVLDAAGRPVDDALVIYFLRGIRSYSAGSWALGGGLDVAVTAIDGRFRFTRVRPHLDYEVEALTRQGRRARAPAATDREIEVRLPE